MGEQKISGKRTHMLDLSHKKENYIIYSKKASRLIYMLFLLIMAICNFLIFLGIIPLMIYINSNLLILIMGTIGLLFGFIFSFLIKDIEHLEPHHHIFAAFFIPLISIVNIFVLVAIGRSIRGMYSYPPGTLLFASFIYVMMFLLPYSLESIWVRYIKKQ